MLHGNRIHRLLITCLFTLLSSEHFEAQNIDSNNVTESDAMYSEYQCTGYSMQTRSCLFRNICFRSSSKTWLYFVDPESATSLPTDTLVNENGSVQWSGSDLFLKSDWSINLSTTYKQEKSKYEADENKHRFDPPDIQNTAIPESAKWDERPHMLFSRTSHDDNVGHLVYDQYHPLLTAIGSHLGMSESKNVVLIDMVENKEVFSHYWPGSYEKGLKHRIGRVLFNKEIRYHEFVAAAKKQPSMVCYRTLLAGCGRVAGMDGGVQSRQGSIRYIRDMLWQEYATENVTISSTEKNDSTVSKSEVINKEQEGNIRILMIQKKDSSWGHLNLIKNWVEIATEVEALKGVTVSHFVPKECEFGQQVVHYKNSDIIISLWGGISMLNFLMPQGGTEVLFTSWFDDDNMLLIPKVGSIDPITKKNITEVPKLLKCPDFDERTRSATYDTSFIRFCSRTEGHDSYSVNITNFLPLLEMVIKNQRWKKRKNIIKSLRSSYRI